MTTRPGRRSLARAGRTVAAALIAGSLLAGCTQTTPGQLAMTIEPVSPDITCSEFGILSASDQLTVVNEILGAAPDKPTYFLVAIAVLLCERAPEKPVKQVLLRLG
ncbi:hypothetical protein [[Mycobacterium] burgundiense]|uniref:Lipoprotein n=1 Tax=[Mycobacterium] burgundiense TaxID=3064286 RepID=A0ABM9L8Q3_9MYCO|nr:hypothetical protein [Mycolicibacterium sp. MU0053]CAJ1494787.1 hypothetical protein MU0053_000160 [Mycolicibacterium sp. MU0053]